MDLKNPILVISPDILLIHGSRNAKRPEEIAPGTFSPMFFRIMPGSLASYCKAVVSDADIEGGAICAGKINGYCAPSASSLCSTSLDRRWTDASSNSRFIRSCRDTKSCKGFHCPIVNSPPWSVATSRRFGPPSTGPRTRKSRGLRRSGRPEDSPNLIKPWQRRPQL